VIALAQQWSARPRAGVAVDLSFLALPAYAALSLARCALACLLSLGFTLVFGYWTMKDPVAGRIFVPVVDTFRRGVPSLGFMPILVLALLSVFPDSNVGL